MDHLRNMSCEALLAKYELPLRILTEFCRLCSIEARKIPLLERGVYVWLCFTSVAWTGDLEEIGAKEILLDLIENRLTEVERALIL